MATTPVEGWYPHPDKEGYLRWWDGAQWTDHEKPAPTVVEASAPPSGKPVEENPSKKSKSKRSSITEAVGATGLAAAGAALAADGAIGLGKKRKGFKGLGKYFITGGLIVVISILMFFTGLIETFSAKERTSTTGVVTQILDGEFPDCIPTVEFTYQGKSYVARDTEYVECVWVVGDPVEVFFDVDTADNPTIGEDIVNPLGGSIAIGVIGWFILGIGIVKLLIRAGSVAGGFLLMREGFKLGKGKQE